MFRRLCLLIPLLLLLGPMLATLTAWTFAVRSPDPPASRFAPRHVGTDHPTGRRIEQFGDFDWRALLHDADATGWRQRRLIAHVKPYTSSSPINRNQIMTYEAGWPILCLYGEDRTVYGDDASRGLFDTPRRLQASGRGMTRLPFIPKWPEFLYASALFATPGFALFILAQPLRRWRRARQGRCLACGYDLRHIASSTCPECGSGDAAAAADHSSSGAASASSRD